MTLTALAAASTSAVAAGAADLVPVDCEQLTPAGDLDRDGVGDVYGLSVRVNELQARCTPDRHELVVRRGSDGALLWSRGVEPGTDVVAARVGEDGERGLFLLRRHSVALVSQPWLVDTLTVVALAGDGTELWSRTFAGAMTSLAGSTAAGLPLLASTLPDAVGGPAHDLIVVTKSWGPGRDVRLTKVLAVDGSDGRSIPVLAQHEQGTDLKIRVAHDLSGDGLDDFVTMTATDGRDTLVARRGTDGEELWRTQEPVLRDDTQIADVDDLNGDLRGELLVKTPQDESGSALRLALLDGRTGELHWKRNAAGVLHKADAQWSLGVFVGRLHAGSRIQLERVTASGEVLGTFPVGDPSTASGATVIPVGFGAGDVDGDGVTEVGSEQLEPYGPGGTGTRVRWVLQDGRYGDVRWSRTSPDAERERVVLPLESHLDRAGDDVVWLGTYSDEEILVEALDGRSGAVLWERALQLPTLTFRVPRLVARADLDGDGIVDLIVSGRAETDRRRVPTVVLSGRDGSLLWSL